MQKRLNKYISDTGHCSRREADALIEQGKVLVNGEPPELGTKIGVNDKVTIGNKLIKPVADNKSDRVYLAYHKPVGITCTTEKKIKDNIIDAINYKQRIFPIGRLDKPSEGLILLTNDGDIVNKILRAENAHDKLYRVTVNKPITAHFLNKMAAGVPILDTVTLPCEIKQMGKMGFEIVLQQGLNRQIRRMCEYLGYEVTRLVRKRIMHINLSNLKVGQYRHLTKAEMLQMDAALANSSKVSSHVANEEKTSFEVVSNSTSHTDKTLKLKNVKPLGRQHPTNRKNKSMNKKGKFGAAKNAYKQK